VLDGYEFLSEQEIADIERKSFSGYDSLCLRFNTRLRSWTVVDSQETPNTRIVSVKALGTIDYCEGWLAGYRNAKGA